MSASAFQIRPVNQLALQVLRRANYDPTPDQLPAVQVLRLGFDPEIPGPKAQVLPRLQEQADAEIQDLLLKTPAQAQRLLDAMDLDLSRLAQETTIADFASELMDQLLTAIQESEGPPAPEQVQ